MIGYISLSILIKPLLNLLKANQVEIKEFKEPAGDEDNFLSHQEIKEVLEKLKVTSPKGIELKEKLSQKIDEVIDDTRGDYDVELTNLLRGPDDFSKQDSSDLNFKDAEG